jgi:hypothetical protein
MSFRLRMVIGLAATFLLVPSRAEPLPRKLLVTGWDIPNTAQFSRDLAAMEQWPFAGVVLYAVGQQTDGKRFDARRAFSTDHWERSAFTGALSDLKAAHSTKLTDNFLLCSANPGDVDWFDDIGWQEIEEHWRILAWLAHEGGLKGLVFDPEAYTAPFKQFDYNSQKGRAQHSYTDYCRKARQRGSALMRTIVSEYPNVVLLNYFLFSYCTEGLVAGPDQESELAISDVALLVPFADGWLDVLPPTALLVDGNERAYHYSGNAAFDAAYVQLKGQCQALVSPANRPKFRCQVQVSHGIYLDLRLNPPGVSSVAPEESGFRAERLEEDVFSALKAADQYVWIYGQRARWWPPWQPRATVLPTWPELFPGVNSALLSAQNPTAGARQRLIALRKRGGGDNLVDNGEFDAAAAGLPAGWSTWQDRDSHGYFGFDPSEGAPAKGSACLWAVKRGCFLQCLKVATRQRLVLSARVRKTGLGSPWLRVRWEDARGRPVHEDRNAGFGTVSELDPSHWSEVVGTVIVPEGAERLILRLGVTGQKTSSDRAWFDDVSVAVWED